MSRNSLREAALQTYARSGLRGFDRLLDATGHRRGERILAQTAFGSWLKLDPRSYIDRIVLTEGYYEAEVLEAILAHLPPGGVVWDVGANIGLHSATLRCRRPDSMVLSFEPSPAVLGALWDNLDLNGGAGTVVTTALSDRSGFETLHIASSGNTGMTTLNPWSEARYDDRVLVAVARGEDLISAGLPAPAVLKVDVEGHEAQVLSGLSSAVSQPACRAIVFEDGANPDSAVKVMLRDLGFAISPLRRSERSSHHALQNFLAARA